MAALPDAGDDEPALRAPDQRNGRVEAGAKLADESVGQGVQSGDLQLQRAQTRRSCTGIGRAIRNGRESGLVL
jgi:hypothetical protein